MKIDQTKLLLSLDIIERARKLANEPISIAIESATANQLGLPSWKRSMRCNVDIKEESIGTDTNDPTMTFFNSLLFI